MYRKHKIDVVEILLSVLQELFFSAFILSWVGFNFVFDIYCFSQAAL